MFKLYSGGPGSHKGRVVDDLMTSYGFKFLSGEDVIFEEFPKSVGKTDQTDATKAVKEAINVSIPTIVKMNIKRKPKII